MYALHALPTSAWCCRIIDCFLSTVIPGLTLPALKDLSNLLNSVTDWHALGVKLGVKSHELETIQRNYPHDTTRCKHEMLVCCLRSANPPTWRDIRDALCQMGEHASAEKIWKEYLQPTKGISAIITVFWANSSSKPSTKLRSISNEKLATMWFAHLGWNANLDTC